MLTRAEAVAACLRHTDVFEDYPFDDPNWTVMRHKGNHKAYAFIFERQGHLWINVKAEPQWGDFWKSSYPAVVPAYHMNKSHWVTVALDGTASDEMAAFLTGVSFDLTQKNK